jgi:hypothetical protein
VSYFVVALAISKKRSTRSHNARRALPKPILRLGSEKRTMQGRHWRRNGRMRLVSTPSPKVTEATKTRCMPFFASPYPSTGNPKRINAAQPTTPSPQTHPRQSIQEKHSGRPSYHIRNSYQPHAVEKLLICKAPDRCRQCKQQWGSAYRDDYSAAIRVLEMRARMWDVG